MNQWRSIPSREATMEWVLDVGQSRIKAIIRMNQGSFYYGLAFAGKAEFLPHNYCTTFERAKERAELLLKKECDEITKFTASYFGALEVVSG